MKKQETIVVRAYGHTDVGRRRNNEDAFLINIPSGLFLVADGMGGHAKGEVASWFTSENLQTIVANADRPSGNMTLDPIDDDTSTNEFLIEHAFIATNQKLHELNKEQFRKVSEKAKDDVKAQIEVAKWRAMGTTLVSLLIRNDRIYIAHAGDSRAYRIAGQTIQQLTQDHSWIEEQVRSGNLSRKIADEMGPGRLSPEMKKKILSGKLSPEEALAYKKRTTIMRSIGVKEEVEVDINTFDLRPPERFLLCSDGLSNVVDEKGLLEFAQLNDLKRACEELVELALANGGKDNITAVLVDVRPGIDQSAIDEGQFTI